MFYTVYDALAKRDADGPMSPIRDRNLPRLRRRTAPQTAETVLFLLEDVNSLVSDDPNPLYH